MTVTEECLNYSNIFFWLIKPNAQDPIGLYRLAKYIRTNTPEFLLSVSGFSLLLALLTSFPFAVSQAQFTDTPSTEIINSQQITLLSPNYAVEIPQAIGGPDDIMIQDGVLLASMGVTDGGTVVRRIEDTSGMSIYVVREGDTLSEIAELFDVSTNTIRWENNIGNTIKPGQELRILPVTGVTHTIKKGDTYGKIANMYDVEIEDITIFNDLDPKELKIGEKIIVPNGVKRSVSSSSSSRSSSSKSNTTSRSSSSSKAQSGYYIRPTAGRVTSKFGPRSGRYHYGIDFGGATGTPIVAAASGTVLKTSCGSGYGKCLVIQHDNGTRTLYAHASTLYVGTGAQVKQGQKIAAVGSTGRSTGPHLHFEIIKLNGQKMNPNPLF